MESRQKKDGQEVASKGHRRDKIENINKKHTDSRNKLGCGKERRKLMVTCQGSTRSEIP